VSKYIYGIDFGTSNSVLAIIEKSTRNIINVLNENSVIYFENDRTYSIGKKAVSDYMNNNLHGRLLKSVKTLLPQPGFTFTIIWGKKYSAEDLVYLILKQLKSDADQITGEDVKEVVLGRPVVFSEDPEKDKLAEKRLLNAARLAGFEKIWLQYEPIAAGFLYEQSITKPELVLIGDFGGGTSDFTLMKLDRNRVSVKERKSDILNTGGIHIGGDDFDSAIMWNRIVKYFGYSLQYESFGKMLDLPVHIYRTLCEWDQIGFLKDGRIRRQLDGFYYSTNKNPALQHLMTLIDFNLGFSVFQKIEKSKIDLSHLEESLLEYKERGIEISENISIASYQDIINSDILKIKEYLLKFIEKSGSEVSHIDNVFLTGGTSLNKSVLNLYHEIFPAEKIHTGDNFTTVAQGLGLSYFYLNQ
jgi:hypothetical chaperone protein